MKLSGYYSGYGLGGAPNPFYETAHPGPNPVTSLRAMRERLQNAFNNTSPDYLAEIQVQIPLRNRQWREQISSDPSWNCAVQR